MHCSLPHSLLFFFNDTATTEIYTLSLHDALPISARRPRTARPWRDSARSRGARTRSPGSAGARSRSRQSLCQEPRERSEEHTSELQSLAYLVCRLLLEKKKQPSHTTLSSTNIPQPVL